MTDMQMDFNYYKVLFFKKLRIKNNTNTKLKDTIVCNLK